MVSTQAQAMLPATPHLTAESPPVAPEPMMEAVIVCVVEIGKPKWLAVKMTAAEPVSAAKPWMGSRWMTLVPSVWMMRRPPKYVPKAIDRDASRSTQVGIGALDERWPVVISARVITPIVFCASLEPWAKATSAAETG